MNLTIMMSFWQMRNMINFGGDIIREKMEDTDMPHFVSKATIVTPDHHAHLLYRYSRQNGNMSHMAFIYADIISTGFRAFPDADRVLIKNASLTDLEKYFVTAVYPNWSGRTYA